MPLNFPQNPVLDQIYPYNNIRWKWNGYAWDSAGICGSFNNIGGGGICGDYVERINDGVGITLTSSTGIVEISIALNEPNIGPTNTEVFHNAPTTFSAESGYARKVAFLSGDGSITFDYIKNYDVFRKAEFQFDIVGFNVNDGTNQINPRPISLANTLLNLSGYQANMTYNQTPVSASINILNASIADQSNFPVTVSSMGYSTHAFTNQSLRYRSLTYSGSGTNNDYYLFRVGATGQNSDGTLSYKTKDYYLYFYNYIFWGQKQNTTITTLANATSDPSLINLLSANKNLTINTTIQFDQQNPYYLYFIYPTRLGVATFRDNATNLEGGFTPQPNPILYTNPYGYAENYTVYRSDNPNLGTISITVS